MIRTRLHGTRSSLLALGTCLAGLAFAGCGGGSPSRDDGTASAAVTSIPSYDVDPTQTSVSGLSSGAFMAVQFHVAFSASVRGAAIFAGGPYDCARGSQATATTTCMSQSSALDSAPYVSTTRSLAQAGAIDSVDHLAAARVFLFGGADDTTVHPAVMDSLASYYEAFVTSGAVTYESRHPGTAHTMPTVGYGSNCDQTSSPYIGKCNYDGAGKALAAIYGALAAPATSLSGTYVTIPQAPFVKDGGAHSLGASAFAYVPKSCADGETCRIHVAFHGCQQGTASVGDAFYKHAGYNEWADTNHVLVVYPQAVAASGNPSGCWDWFGYDSADYAKKSGPQMAMVKALIDHLAGGASPLPDGGTTPDAAPGPTDAGAASDASAPDAAPPAVCFLASNADHVQAGRARAQYGLAFATGSSEYLGPATLYAWTSLREATPGAWVIGLCR
jgi:poly(3-hydroxybutyrate) depolymerase